MEKQACTNIHVLSAYIVFCIYFSYVERSTYETKPEIANWLKAFETVLCDDCQVIKKSNLGIMHMNNQ
jgi:hypothetical protein